MKFFNFSIFRKNFSFSEKALEGVFSEITPHLFSLWSVPGEGAAAIIGNGKIKIHSFSFFQCQYLRCLAFSVFKQTICFLFTGEGNLNTLFTPSTLSKATYENMTEEIFLMYGLQSDLNKTKKVLEEMRDDSSKHCIFQFLFLMHARPTPRKPLQ